MAAGADVAWASPPRQQLATLRHDTSVHAAPSANSPRLRELVATRPITGERTVVPVIARERGGWLRVLLPGRPNSHSGWIAAASVRLSMTPWRIVVRLSTRALTVFRDGRVAAAFEAVVGKASTPTPTGRFFVEETVRLDPLAAGAPYALALSARSNVLASYEGGPGQVALHGVENIGGVPGTAASHGCVRLSTAAISWLAARIRPGTPVTIEP